jgi:predicted dithiol-disulfide oxidoreductase (DUF899 family)
MRHDLDGLSRARAGDQDLTETSMDTLAETLIPAATLAAENDLRIRGESAEYRAARTALLAEEIELRRHMERVAAQRRALPAGAPVTGDYRFQTEAGPSDLAGLFGDKQTLAICSYMFGPQLARPCPMCTNVLGAWEGNAADIGQNISLVVVARSPIERLLAWKRERGWKDLRLASDLDDAYSRDFFGVLADGSDVGCLNVFTRRDGTIRHFWSDELRSADPGQDPRGSLATCSPTWLLLDATPEGRPRTWYPSLTYA